MKEFYPWQPFSECWEPDEGMLAEIERDGMVAWARRERFHWSVQYWLREDPGMLEQLETSDRAQMYGFGPIRPLHIPGSHYLDGNDWAANTLPGLAQQAEAMVDDPVALRSFEQRIGRDDLQVFCRTDSQQGRPPAVQARAPAARALAQGCAE